MTGKSTCKTATTRHRAHASPSACRQRRSHEQQTPFIGNASTPARSPSEGRAVLISGPSGSGKSDLALRLIDRGFTLVSDDQTIVRRDGDRLFASAPPTIKGKLEIRGVGIVEMETVKRRPVALSSS